MMLRACFACLFALFLCAEAFAAEEDEYTDANCEPLSPDLKDLKPFMGKKVSLRGKYKEVRGEIVLLDECRVQIYVSDEQTGIQKTVFILHTLKDNVAVFGTVVEHVKHGYVLEAKRLDQTGSDFEILKARIASVAAGGDNAAAYEEAAKWGAEIAKKYPDEQIPPLVEKTFRTAFEIERKKAGNEHDARKLASVAAKFVEHLADAAAAIEIYRTAYEFDPNLAAVSEGLKKLGCVLVKGKWLTKEEYMKAEGFVFFRGRWMRPVEKEFEEFVAKWKTRSDIIPTLTPEQAKVSSNEKKLGVGMKIEDAALSWGHPDDKLEKSEGADKYMMWIMKNGARIFFKNRQVIEWKEGQ